MRSVLYIAVMYTLFYLLLYMMYYYIIYYINNPTCITLYSLGLMKMKPRRHKGCCLYVIMLMVVKITLELSFCQTPIPSIAMSACEH